MLTLFIQGHAAFDLYDEVDFDSWLTSSLGQELNIKVFIRVTVHDNEHFFIPMPAHKYEGEILGDFPCT